MKKIIFLFLCFLIHSFSNADECVYLLENQELKFEVTDGFGCLYENREFQFFENNDVSLLFELTETDEPALQLKISNNGSFRIFDTIPYFSPETDKIRDVVFIKNNNILFLLHGYNATIINELGETEVDAAFYKISIYKLYNNVPIKISSTKLTNHFAGIDGFYNGKYQRYPYKSHIDLLNEASLISLSCNDILTSLEKLLKNSVNNVQNSSINFINIDILNLIISDIPINKYNVEYYNNIAFYFSKIKKHEESIFLLNKIISLFPSRTVAYINLGDSFWDMDKKEDALQNYRFYIELMTKQNKQSKIPQRIRNRLITSEN